MFVKSSHIFFKNVRLGGRIPIAPPVFAVRLSSFDSSARIPTAAVHFFQPSPLVKYRFIGSIFSSVVQNLAAMFGKYLRLLTKTSNGSPIRDAELSLTVLYVARLSTTSYSTQVIFYAPACWHSRTNSKVSEHFPPGVGEQYLNSVRQIAVCLQYLVPTYRPMFCHLKRYLYVTIRQAVDAHGWLISPPKAA